MTEQEKIEYIERYLKGKLNPQEQEEFEQFMLEDESFAEEVRQHQQVNEIIEDAGLMNVKRRLQALQNSGAGSTGKFGSSIKKGLIGIGGIVLVGLGIWAGHPLFDQEAKSLQSPQTESSPTNEKVEEQEADSQVTNKPKLQNPSSGNQNSAQSNNSLANHPIPPKIQLQNEDLTISALEINTFSLLDTAPTLKGNEVRNPDMPETQSIDPCQNTNISANFKTTPSCQGEATGKILIDKDAVYGGKPPYRFFIEEEERLETDLQIDELSSGSYTLIVQDQNDCSQTYPNVYIEEKSCDATKQFVFVPKEESKWKYPINDNANGELEIRNRNGRLILKEQIRNGMPKGWRGRTNTGKPAPMGAYQVVFTPFDGQPRTWLLTVIR